MHKAHAVGVNYFLLLFASVIQFEGNNQKCGELGSLYALHRTSEKNTSAQQQSSSQMARGGGYFEAEALLKARETHVCNENDVEEEGFWPQDRVSSPEWIPIFACVVCVGCIDTPLFVVVLCLCFHIKSGVLLLV